MSGVVGVVFAGGVASRGGDQSAGVIKVGWSHRTTSESHTQTTPIGMSRNVTGDRHACPCVPGAVPSHVFVTHTARSRHSAAQHWPSVAPPSDSPSSIGRTLSLPEAAQDGDEGLLPSLLYRAVLHPRGGHPRIHPTWLPSMTRLREKIFSPLIALIHTHSCVLGSHGSPR